MVIYSYWKLRTRRKRKIPEYIIVWHETSTEKREVIMQRSRLHVSHLYHSFTIPFVYPRAQCFSFCLYSSSIRSICCVCTLLYYKFIVWETSLSLSLSLSFLLPLPLDWHGSQWMAIFIIHVSIGSTCWRMSMSMFVQHQLNLVIIK